jgi:3D (Asp-Asp-Asp) domain-containing protein
MKTRKQILVVMLIAISLMSSTAHAGLLDDIVGMLTGNTRTENADSSIFANMSAMVATSSPVTATSTKVTRTTRRVEVSCYTSEVKQTDASPFIAARGDYVQYGMVAANMFPIGTVMKIHGIPTVSDDEIFVVRDRMNTRYQNNVDIWVTDKDMCLHTIGRRMATIEIIK